MKEQKVLQIQFAGLAGIPRKMSILKMSHRDFWETYHTVIQAISGGAKISKGKFQFNPIEILKGLDFDAFEQIADRTLGYGVLDGVGTIKVPVIESEHFFAHPEELYTAVYAGFTANNPDMFPKKQAGVADKSADSAPQNKGSEAAPGEISAE